MLDIDKTIAILRKGWTRNIEATDINGYSVLYDSPYAVYWCLDGALRASGASNIERELFNRFTVQNRGYTNVGYNDQVARNVEDVINLLEAYRKFQNWYGSLS